MSQTMHIIRGTLLLLLVVGIAGWLMWRAYARSGDRRDLVIRWLLTAAVGSFMYWVAFPLAGRGGGEAFMGVGLAAFCGLAVAALWRHSIGAMIARPFTMLYDGGDVEVEPRPLYSIAQSKRKLGRYPEAVVEIRRQLTRFPTDFEGQMLLAEIQAENLNDLPGADVTIQRLCQQPGHEPRNIALALNTLADWYLKLIQDRDSARQALERIIALYPETDIALVAAQRIGHLAETRFLVEPHERRRIVVKPGVQDVGLLSGAAQPKAAEPEYEAQAAHYAEHLRVYPLDTEAREKLAVLYSEHYKRLDLATEQLEQLIAYPNQPPRQVAHWLNLLADLQVRHSADYETVRQTLERIIEGFPGTPAAGLARTRIDHLKLELKANEKGRAIKLGSYEQDLGLKQRSPHQL